MNFKTWPTSIPSDFWEFSLKDLNGIFKSEISLKAFLTFQSHVIRICLQENTFGSNPRQNIFEIKIKCSQLRITCSSIPSSVTEKKRTGFVKTFYFPKFHRNKTRIQIGPFKMTFAVSFFALEKTLVSELTYQYQQLRIKQRISEQLLKKFLWVIY